MIGTLLKTKQMVKSTLKVQSNQNNRPVILQDVNKTYGLVCCNVLALRTLPYWFHFLHGFLSSQL